MDEDEQPQEVAVHYRDGHSVVYRGVVGDRVRKLEDLAFTDPDVVSTEARSTDFDSEVERLIERVRQAGDVLSVLRMAARVQTRVEEELGGLVGLARLAGASWELIGRELGLSKQTTYNRYLAFDLRGEAEGMTQEGARK